LLIRSVGGGGVGGGRAIAVGTVRVKKGAVVDAWRHMDDVSALCGLNL
jgi:hypothetical protein